MDLPEETASTPETEDGDKNGDDERAASQNDCFRDENARYLADKIRATVFKEIKIRVQSDWEKQILRTERELIGQLDYKAIADDQKAKIEASNEILTKLKRKLEDINNGAETNSSIASALKDKINRLTEEQEESLRIMAEYEENYKNSAKMMDDFVRERSEHRRKCAEELENLRRIQMRERNAREENAKKESLRRRQDEETIDHLKGMLETLENEIDSTARDIENKVVQIDLRKKETEEWKLKCLQAERELEDLKVKVNEKTARNKANQENIKEITENYENRNRQIKTELDSYVSRNTEYDKAISNLTASNSEINAKNIRLEEEYSKLQLTAQTTSNEIDAAKETNEAIHENIKKIDINIATQRQKECELIEELKSLNQKRPIQDEEINDTRNMMQNEELSYENEIHNLKCDYQSQLADQAKILESLKECDSIVDSLNGEEAMLLEQSENCDEGITELESEIRCKDEHIKELINNFENLKRNISEEETRIADVKANRESEINNQQQLLNSLLEDVENKEKQLQSQVGQTSVQDVQNVRDESNEDIECSINASMPDEHPSITKIKDSNDIENSSKKTIESIENVWAKPIPTPSLPLEIDLGLLSDDSDASSTSITDHFNWRKTNRELRPWERNGREKAKRTERK